MPVKKGSLLSVLFCLCFFIQSLKAQTKVEHLSCEYMTFPPGIDAPEPRLSWRITSATAQKQTAYRVLVATSRQLLLNNKGDVWDSKRTPGEEQIVYLKGNKLIPHTQYWWQVEVWSGAKRLKSRPAWFETAKLQPSDWEAQWITDRHNTDYEPSPLFRKEFTSAKKVRSAKCYISGLGYYQLYINGTCINPNTLDPGFTDFSKRVLYLTHDVSSYIQKGDNSLGIQLGNGWFNEQTPTVWNFHKAPWRKRPQVICELHISYTDGTKQVIKTDESWKCSTGSWRFDNIHVGATYDANMEQESWSQHSFDDSNWEWIKPATAPAPVLEAQTMPSITATGTIDPVSVKKLNDSCYVFDMGINFAGVPQLKVKGQKGTAITLRHAEMMGPDGHIDQRNINMHLRPRNAREMIQTDIYILKGLGKETFVPAFTYHGFRYIELKADRPIAREQIELQALRLHSNVPVAGNFRCSNNLLNDIFSICKNSYLSNLFGIPTDCPTREKNGWMADGFMVQEAGMLSYHSASVYAKWVKDMIDAQDASGNVPGIVPTSWEWDSEWAGPVWDAAIFIVPSLLYQYHNDLESIKNIYPACQRYLKYVASIENDKGLLTEGLGDWLYYKAITPKDFMSSCYYYWDNVLMVRMAKLLGKQADEQQYSAKAEQLRSLINQYYFDKENLVYANGTQLSYALPLYMNIAPAEQQQALARKLNDVVAANNYSLDFGFIGSLIVPEVLSHFGYAASVYKMVTKETLPSWGYWIKNYDATSLFETWDVGRNIGDASRNHPSMGAIAAWMYKTLAGINMDPSATAFKKIIIKPAFIKDLDFVEAYHESFYGTIKSVWKRKKNAVTLDIEIPATCSATVMLPGGVVKEVKGGIHRFTFTE